MKDEFNNDRKFLITVFVVPLAVILFVVAVIFDLDLFEYLIGTLMVLDHLEIDEIIIPGALVIFALLVDLLTNKRRHEYIVEKQKLSVLRMTMHTVHDILNNFLFKMQFYLHDIEDSLSPESSSKLKSLISETSDKLTAIGELEEISEVETSYGSMINYGEKSSEDK